MPSARNVTPPDAPAYPADEEGTAAARPPAALSPASILESISDAFFALDERWRFVYLNDRAAEVLQRPREDLLGRALWDEFPAAVGSDFERQYRLAVAERRTVGFTAFFQPLGAWFEVRAYPLEGGLAVYFHDVTERRRTEEALRFSEQRLAGLVATAMDAIVTTDSGRRIVLFNGAAERLFRLPVNEALGRRIDDFIPERLRASHAAKMLAFGESGVTSRSMHRPGAVLPALRADGTEMFVEATISQTYAAGQRFYNVILRDVTERLREATALQRATAEAEEARADAEAASRAKSQFLATMSHELRTPLNAILGYTDLMELGVAGPLAPSQRDFLARVRASGQHLLGLIDEILDLAKVEAGQMSVQHDPEPLAAPARRAAELVMPQADARGIALRVPTDEASRAAERDLVFLGDEGRVAQILLNLLSNAVKFTHPGGAVTASWDRARPDELPAALGATGRDYVYIRVSDTGIGVAQDQLEAIFEPFVQLDSSHSRQQGGTGLGLAISRKLARLMEGDLTVESSPGVGSTFTLWLPASTPPAARRPRPADERTEIARLLLGCAEEITLSLVRRLRADPAIPFARDAASTELENHVQSFLADIFQHVAIIDDASADRTLLIRDGSHIQHIIADLHGAQRAHLGWTEAALVREFELLAQEVARVVRRTLGDRALGTDAEDIVTLLDAFLADAAQVSLEGFGSARRRRAAVESPPDRDR